MTMASSTLSFPYWDKLFVLAIYAAYCNTQPACFRSVLCVPLPQGIIYLLHRILNVFCLPLGFQMRLGS